MKKIPLTRGKFTLVDDADYEYLSQFKWQHYMNGRGHEYAVRSKRQHPLPRLLIKMHREIMKPSDDQVVDHRDGNGLNNTRANLRICSAAENVRNRRKNQRNKFRKTPSSRFKGVYRQEDAWLASICHNRKTIYLGSFRSEECAAQAYDVAARKLHGQFASVNAGGG